MRRRAPQNLLFLFVTGLVFGVILYLCKISLSSGTVDWTSGASESDSASSASAMTM